MGKRPLVREQIDAGATFLREFEKYAPVDVAFWYCDDGDDSSPILWVASQQFNDANSRPAYGEVIRIARAMSDPNFDGFQVKVVSADERLAQAAIELMRKYGGKIPAHYINRTVGEITVDEIYIYPLAVAAM